MTNLLKIIKKYVKNKTVLDVGAVQHSWEYIKNSPKPFLHDFLKQHAKKCIGIDIEPKMVEDMQIKGYDIILMNAEKLKFKKQFDTIFAGDIIEHLENAGNFLKNAHKTLKPKGTLIITTCNTFSINRIKNVVKTMKDPPVHKQHTCWYCSNTLKQLLNRTGFKTKKIGYYYWNKRNIIIQHITKLITGKENMYDMIYIIATKK